MKVTSQRVIPHYACRLNRECADGEQFRGRTPFNRRHEGSGLTAERLVKNAITCWRDANHSFLLSGWLNTPKTLTGGRTASLGNCETCFLFIRCERVDR